MKRSLVAWLMALAALVAPSIAEASYSNLFVFGDSLSDSGNNAVVFAPLAPNNVTPVPISGNSFIPTFPYASGHYTNAQVWAQVFASSLGLNANPSLLGGTDYAFGGATTGPLSPNPLPGGLLAPFPASLETQAAFFLLQHANVAPADALYVVAGGANDARNALTLIGGCGGNPVCVGSIINSTASAFVMNVETIVHELEVAGARHIVVWDTPDIGRTPAVLASGPLASATASLLASDMNLALMAAIAGDPDVMLFDLFGEINTIVANPGAFGLTNVTDACASLAACNPSQYLFWDGIHPTSAGHQLLSNAMVGLVPEPTTLALLGLGIAGLVVSRRRTVN